MQTKKLPHTRLTGERIAAFLHVPVKDALYHKDGEFYHLLTKFPGALFDSSGYVLFNTKDDFRNCKWLTIRAKHKLVDVHDSIKKIPGYRPFKGDAKKRIHTLLLTSQAAPDGANTKAVVPTRGLRTMLRNLSRGAGFGDPETNRKIERAGIKAAKRYYREHGWSVDSVESQNLGYDLRCHRNDHELHVEVKGASGHEFAFTLTRREYMCASEDKHFELCFVASALTHPTITTMPGDKIFRTCDVSPLAYRITLTAHVNPAAP